MKESKKIFITMSIVVVAVAAAFIFGNSLGEGGSSITGNTVNTQGSDGNPKVVEMTASQFEFNPSTVTVEKGRTLRLEITSTDVPHGIAIPEFGVNQRLPVGQTKTVEFTPDQTGTFEFVCSVPCGTGHHSMKGKLVVN